MAIVTAGQRVLRIAGAAKSILIEAVGAELHPTHERDRLPHSRHHGFVRRHEMRHWQHP